MKYEEVMIGLKQGKYAPAYMLCGKESYYIDLVANYIENNVLDEMAREFDQTIIYGKDLSGGDVSPVIGAARGFSMMGGYKVIIVKEAQHIKKWEALAMYMDNPQPSTLLVFCYKYGSPDKRLALFKNWEKRIMTPPCFTTASAFVSAVKALCAHASPEVITISAGYSTVCVHLLLAPFALGV